LFNKTEYHRLYQKRRYHEDKEFREKYKSLQKINYQKRKDTIYSLALKKKTNIISHYTKGCMACVCCGVTGLKFLTIDHINNDGKLDRMPGSKFYNWIIENNYPSNLQVLCWNCNMGKNLNNGKCPHKTPKTI